MLGLLGRLLTLPYSLPKAGITYCLERITEMAEAEYYDDAAVREELLLLHQQLEEGEIDETEHRRREAPLLARLREVRERRQGRAAGTGPEPGVAHEVAIEMPEEIRR